MAEHDSGPPVACTITDDRAAERAGWMREELVPRYAGASERDDGVVVRFDGVDGTIRHVARFVAEERECCAFADYRIGIALPYDETRLTITGPDGTKELFVAEFLPRLEGTAPMDPVG